MVTKNALAKLAVGFGIPCTLALTLITSCSKQAPPPPPIPKPREVAPQSSAADYLSLKTPETAAAQPSKASKATQEARKKVEKISDDKFCFELGRSVRSAIKKPTEYSAAMVEKATTVHRVRLTDISAIEKRQPEIGMEACAILAALGQPERSNRSVLRNGDEHLQLVYSGRRLYIYLENGKLVSYQD